MMVTLNERAAAPSPAADAVLPALDPTKFPNTRYWHEDAWRAKLKEESGETDTSGVSHTTYIYKFRFVEDENGNPVSAATLTSIRAALRPLFRGLIDAGYEVNKWTSDTNHTIRLGVFDAVERQFECLRYCERHWKVHAICQEIFPTWIQAHKAKFAGKKHRSSTPSTGGHKKAKISVPQEFQFDE